MMEEVKKQNLNNNPSDDKAMKLTESSREEWQKTSFLKEIFIGNFALNLIDPFPTCKD
jgi:hypothetical protein